MPARSIGTATISFGLVSIPTKLYTTNESSGDIHFNMLHEADGARLKQQYICTKCNEVVDREHTVKGYEHAKGQYVIFSAEELKAPTRWRLGDRAREFVPAAVDPLSSRRLLPGPRQGWRAPTSCCATRCSATLAASRATPRAASSTSCAAPFKRLDHAPAAEEVKPWRRCRSGLPELKPAELGLAKQIIQQIAHETFSPENYKDDVQARMMDLIQKKIEGQEITMVPEAPAGKVIDLMEALKASLGMAKGADAERKPAIAADAPAAEEPKKKASKKK
jgi:DNA end-binding protein Ku